MGLAHWGGRPSQSLGRPTAALGPAARVLGSSLGEAHPGEVLPSPSHYINPHRPLGLLIPLPYFLPPGLAPMFGVVSTGWRKPPVSDEG
jgi:hypothetical protein